jgi:hypothetical protein
MINLILILTIALILLTSNYAALHYGIQLGKAMQKDIPPSPVQNASKGIKRTFATIRDTKKSYMQKKQPDKEESGPYD